MAKATAMLIKSHLRYLCESSGEVLNDGKKTAKQEDRRSGYAHTHTHIKKNKKTNKPKTMSTATAIEVISQTHTHLCKFAGEVLNDGGHARVVKFVSMRTHLHEHNHYVQMIMMIYLDYC